MKSIIEISASTAELQDHFDVLSCFLNSATTLHAVACNGIVGSSGNIGRSTPEYWNEHFVTAFFLFRHALELSIKALIKEMTGVDVRHHNIKKMWEENIPACQNVIPEKINKAFIVLAKFHVLKDAQLFRYHTDKGGIRLKDMPLIQNDDFDAISIAAWEIRQLILECIHVKKVCLLCKSEACVGLIYKLSSLFFYAVPCLVFCFLFGRSASVGALENR